jgi:sortase A
VNKQLVSSFGRWLTVTGVVLLMIYAGTLAFRSISSRRALQEFDQARTVAEKAERKETEVAPDVPTIDLQTYKYEKVDFSLWSPKRVTAYSESLKTDNGSALAVLRLERFNLRVPVFERTDDLTLNRGAGWIQGTARPGATGNIGIAGHRDGFFRGLKDVVKGDRIELATVARAATYIVDQIEIVSPSDVRVLQPRSTPSLTLVTCYPFYFVGAAPRRFIVHASLGK